MSRIGKKVIALPAGVTVNVEGSDVTVKGSKGTLKRFVDSSVVELKQEGAELSLVCKSESKDARAKHGLYRSLVANMVTGVSSGFTKTVVMNGIGYKSAVNGNKLVLNIGYSHPIEIVAPQGITFECAAVVGQKAFPNDSEINISGCDKELVGQIAANIKAKRPVEPYHAYGIRYKGERFVVKEGKKSGK